jgi:nucleotidyltransferase substrate binding protein (TIGR01987 family)
MALDLSSLRKAISFFDRTIEVACSNEKMSLLDNDQKDAIRAGVIQNFEFTYELCWKFLKRWLGKNYANEYVDGITRKELFRLAAENHLISDVKRWMEFHSARNETSHTYNDAIAKSVFETAKDFLADAKSLIKVLEEKND